jgi:cytochrome c oxidase subunit II
MRNSITFLFQSVLEPASKEAKEINHLFGYFTIAAVCLLLLVSLLVVYICFRFRDRPGRPTPKQTGKNNRLELMMFLFPVIMISIFLFLTIRTMNRVMKPAEGQPEAIITGHQWWWEVYYPATGVRGANEIHLPINKKLLLEFRSSDVIHDWWVPALGNKMDVIPGRNNHLWLTIINAGDFVGACSEFCGAEHAWMRIKIFAQSESDYQSWLLQNAKPANMPSDELAMTGMLLFQTASCGSCHAISGTNSKAKVGPDLTHIFSRSTLLSGMMPMTEENLHDWISDPQLVKPDAKMPNFIFSKDSVDAIVHYLTQLK